MVCQVVKDMQAAGEDSVSQAQVVNKLVQIMEIEEGSGTTLERSLETSKKINNVI